MVVEVVGSWGFKKFDDHPRSSGCGGCVCGGCGGLRTNRCSYTVVSVSGTCTYLETCAIGEAPPDDLCSSCYGCKNCRVVFTPHVPVVIWHTFRNIELTFCIFVITFIC